MKNSVSVAGGGGHGTLEICPPPAATLILLNEGGRRGDSAALSELNAPRRAADGFYVSPFGALPSNSGLTAAAASVVNPQTTAQTVRNVLRISGS